MRHLGWAGVVLGVFVAAYLSIASAAPISWAGINDSELTDENRYVCDCWPPQPAIAVGPNHVVIVANRAVRVFSKTGTTLKTMTWEDMNLYPTGGLFPHSVDGTGCWPFRAEPSAEYDPIANRYVVVIQSHYYTGSALCVAVSNTSDPTGTWHTSAYQISSTASPDFTHAVIGPDAIYASGVINGSTGSVTRLYAISKAAYTGQGTMVMRDVGIIGSWPVRNAPSGMFVGSDPGQIKLWTWTDPFGANVLTEQSFTPAPAAGTVWAKQPGQPDIPTGGSGTLSAQYRNGSVFAVDSVGANGRAAVRWFELRNGAIAQQNVISSPDVDRYYPGLNVDRDGRVLIMYSASSATMNPSIWQTAGGVESSVLTGTVVRPRNGTLRYGESVGVAVDPDGCRLWQHQQLGQAPGFYYQTWVWSHVATGCGATATPTPTPTACGKPRKGC